MTASKVSKLTGTPHPPKGDVPSPSEVKFRRPFGSALFCRATISKISLFKYGAHAAPHRVRTMDSHVFCDVGGIQEKPGNDVVLLGPAFPLHQRIPDLGPR